MASALSAEPFVGLALLLLFLFCRIINVFMCLLDPKAVKRQCVHLHILEDFVRVCVLWGVVQGLTLQARKSIPFFPLKKKARTPHPIPKPKGQFF